MKKSHVLVMAACYCSQLLLSANVLAATVSATGDISLISPPSDVTLGVLVSDTEIRVFDEVQGFTLIADLNVSLGLDGGSVISAGTTINSHFVHKDSLTNGVMLSGSVTFDAPILGIIASVNGLDTTDPFLGLAGTSYPTGLNNRGTAIIESGDVISFVGSTFTLTSNTTTRPDQVRVITGVETVPIPATVWLFGSGLLGLIGIARRKKV